MRRKVWLPVLLVLPLCPSCGGQSKSEEGKVPFKYRALYRQLEASLDAFDADLINRWEGERSEVVFAAELLPANSHRGPELLREQALHGVRLYLERLRAIGLGGVKVCLSWALFLRPSAETDGYWTFYRKVAEEVRRQGMKLLVGTGPLFNAPEFGAGRADYSRLTFDQYVEVKREVVRRIVREIKPDFLTVSNEPLTEARVTGLKELADPRRFVEAFKRTIQSLPRTRRTKIGAGSGSWDDLAFVKLLCKLDEIDYVDIHIYPVTGGFLQRASEMAELARRAGKGVVVGEAWLYKATHAESTGAHVAATWAEIFRRDGFSFFEPLDKKFVETMAHFAHCHKVWFLSLFWSRHFFAYLKHNEKLERLPAGDLFRLANEAAVRNILKGKFSGTGKFYADIISGRAGGLGYAFRNGKKESETKSPRLGKVRILGRGARPRFSPDGGTIVFDRKNPDGFYDVYLMDLKGRLLRSITEGKPGLPQRHNGNAVFHPSGRFVVFVSEEERHLWPELLWLGDPGLGIFCNLWATDAGGRRFWRLTAVPIKRGLTDPTPAFAVVNPLFSPDGRWLLWTERYGPGGHHNWGRWRIKRARWTIRDGRPHLEGEEVLFLPQKGNYVTAVAFLDENHLLLAGNLDGQHEYGMDQYVLDLRTGALKNLHHTPKFWEEDATVTPDGRFVIYMSNAASRYPLNFADPNWPAQPRERDYWMVDREGKRRERLTFFNDPEAPEYLGRRTIVAAADVSPDGRWLAMTLGIDFGTKRRAKIALKVALAEILKKEGGL